MAKHSKKRIPQLSYTDNRGIGFYVSYRDPTTGSPRKHRFGMIPREKAVLAYNEWVGAHLLGKTPRPKPLRVADFATDAKAVDVPIVDGSLLHVVSGLLTYDESRLRKDGEPKSKGTIGRIQFTSRRDLSRDFLAYLNERHGAGAVGRMKLADLKMEDVEGYNRRLRKTTTATAGFQKAFRSSKRS